MRNFEFQFDLRSPLPLVFATYIDTNRWRNRGIVKDIQWVQGNPWEEGSRLRLEIADPIPATMDQVLVHYAPNREIAYIGHVLGMTFNWRLVFLAVSERETRIHITMEMVGKPSRLFSFAIEPTLEKTTRQFFDDLKKECEHKWAALQKPHTLEAANSLQSSAKAPRASNAIKNTLP